MPDTEEKEYSVVITEVLQKEIRVKAVSVEDALDKAEERYSSAEDDYVLSSEDYVKTIFTSDGAKRVRENTAISNIVVVDF